MDSTGEASSSGRAQSTLTKNEALAALLFAMLSSPPSPSTTEAIPLAETGDSGTSPNRKGKAPVRATISESQPGSSSAPLDLFSTLLESLVNSDTNQLPNDAASHNGNPVQLPNSADSAQGHIESADDLFFPTSSRSLPPHPVFVQVHEFLRTGLPPRSSADSDSEVTVIDDVDEQSDESYPRNLPSYHPDEDYSRYWRVPLDLQDKRRRFALDLIDIGDGLSVEQVTNTDRLGALLQSQPPVRFIRIGPHRTSSNALEMIFTKYEVSPQFLDTFGSECSLSELGGLGVGVRSRLLFSETDPREVRGYHLWYKLPYRRSGGCPDIREQLVEETPSRGLILRKTSNAIATAEIRPYMAYDVVTRSSSTLIYTPHAESYLKPALAECLRHSKRLDFQEDPFGVHLIHFLEVATSWKVALWLTSLELSILENEALRANDAHILALTRTFHTISIHIARWRSELQVTVDIVAELRLEQDHFYDTVLNQPDRRSRPPVYHRLQCAFKNSKTALKAHLVCVTEFEDRIKNCTSLLFHTVKDRSTRQLLAVTNNMASTNDAMRQITEQGRESGELMTEIAKGSREDSYAMKSIAILTMFYLPGAFVTSIFGMQLVKLQGDPGHETLSIARPWPVYVIFLIMLTFATFGVWAGWMWWARRRTDLKKRTQRNEMRDR